jgi:RNA polymerase sigma factor (sigma-70 family)
VPRVGNRQVVEELKSGNPAGCRHLVGLYQTRLLHEAMSVFHVRREDAEELVSDVLLSVVKKIDSFEFKKSEADFHFWVMAVFRNRLRDFMRRQAARGGMVDLFGEAGFEEEEEFTVVHREVLGVVVADYQESLAEQPAAGADPNSTRGKLKVISEVLDVMESWERVLLRCRALDVPYEEIAQYTGKTPAQLKVYHARVKQKFVKLLAERYPELVAK